MRVLHPLLAFLLLSLGACAMGTMDDVATNERPYDDDDEDLVDASVDAEEAETTDASADTEGDEALPQEGDADAGSDAAPDSNVGADASCEPSSRETLGPCGHCGIEVRECLEDGTFGDPFCETEGVCAPGAIDSEACGACGTRTRACSNSCQWGAWSGCEGEGVCVPGEVLDGVGDDRCNQRVCTDSCEWGESELKPTSVCDWKGGHNPQCCGTEKWQYCLSSCQWAPCQACAGNASCLNLCR